MGSFEALFQPEKAENHDSRILTFLLGIVKRIDDPENLGRIQVSVPQIDPDKPLPNGDDGWVLRGTAFTLNETQGGRYEPIELGTEVLLAPINGDIRQVVAICCVPNRKDKPYQEFNVTKGKYGTATRGGTYEIFDDKKGSKFNAFPTGVLQSVSPEGGIIQQTKDKARIQLNSDGSSSIGNDQSSTSHSPDGTVQTTSGKATTKLSPDGKITLSGQGWSEVVLQQSGIKISAPATAHARTLNDLNGFLSSEILIALDQLKALSAISEQFLADLDNPDRILQPGEEKDDIKYRFVIEFSTILKKLSVGIVTNLPVAIDVLSQFEGTIIDDFSVIIKPSIMEGLRLKLDDLVKVIKEKVGDGKSEIKITVEDLPKKFLSVLTIEEKRDLPKKIEAIAPNLKALNHDPEWMIQLIVATVVPKGWASIESLVGLGIYDKIVDLERTINPKVGELAQTTKKTESQWWDDLQTRVQDTIAKLPEDLQELASKAGLDEAFKTTLGSDGITESEHSLVYSGTLLGSLWGCKQGAMYEKPGAKAPMKSAEPGAETSDEEPVTDEIDLEQLKNLLVPGESPLPVLIGLLLQNLVQESLERLKEIKDSEDSVDTIVPVLNLVEFFKEKDSEAEGSREKIVELLKKVEEATTAPVDTDEKKKVSELMDKAIKETLPKAGEMLQKRISPKLESAFSKTFNRLLDSIPTVPTGAEIEMSNEKISLQSGDRGLGAMVSVETGGASIFGPQFDEDGKNRPELSIAKSDIAFKVGDAGPIFRMDRRVTEMLGAEREEDTNPDETLTTTSSDYKFEDMAGGGKSGDKSKTWERPSDEVTYRVAKDGSFKPFDLSLAIQPGGTKTIPTETKLNKKPKPIGGDPKLNKKPCTIRASVTLERTGAAVVRSGLKGGVMSVHNKKAEIYGPEIQDPQGNSFRSNLFAYEDQAGGQAGPSGGIFYVSPDVSEFLAPERGDGEYQVLDPNKSKTADQSYEVKKDSFRVSDSGELENYSRQTETAPTTRSGFSADKTGRVVTRSGDKGAYMIADGNKLQVFGPETEDGERYQMVATDEIAGVISGKKDGAITFVNGDRAQVFGPKKDGVRSTLLAKGGEILTSAGGEGASSLLSQTTAKLLGPKGKGVLNFTEDLVEMIGRDNKSSIRMIEGLVEMVGPDATKALKIGENLVQLIGGAGSNLTMTGGMVNLSGLGSGLRLTPLLSELTSPFLGAFRMLPGISEVSGGGNSMVVSTAGVYFAVGGAILGLAASGMASIGSKKSSMRNGDEESESGVGMILDPQENKAALVAYHTGEWNRPITELPDNLDQLPNNEEPNNADWEHQSARVYVSDQTVYIQSISLEGEILTEITVGPDGVKINGRNLQDSEGLSEEIEDLRHRVTNLESSVN